MTDLPARIERAVGGVPAEALAALQPVGPCWFCAGRAAGDEFSSCTRLFRSPQGAAGPVESGERCFVVIPRCAACRALQRSADAVVRGAQVALVVPVAAVVALLPLPEPAKIALWIVAGAAALLGGIALGGRLAVRHVLRPRGVRAAADRFEHPRLERRLADGWRVLDVAGSRDHGTATLRACAALVYTERGDLEPLLGAVAEARGGAAAEARGAAPA